MEDKQIEVIKKESVTPGLGVAGLVMCEELKSLCIKQACEKWVELKCGDTFVGRCCHSWDPVLLTEIRQSIDKLTDTFNLVLQIMKQMENK